MLSDLNRVDFGNVQEQASWVCNPCSGDVVKLIEVIFSYCLSIEFPWQTVSDRMKQVIQILFSHSQTEFKHTLEAESSLETWAAWLESVVDKVCKIFLDENIKIRS